MNWFAFSSLLRSLTRYPGYAAINVFGLAIGIAVFLILLLFVRFESGFETWVPNHDEIYVVQSIWDMPESPVRGAYRQTMGGLLEQMREDFPGVVGTRIRGGEDGGIVRQGESAIAEDVVQVDASFFEVFDLPMVRGEGRAVLVEPSAALISERAARRYFGESDPIGRTLQISVDDPRNYRIAGVFRDIPDNSDLKLSVLIPLPQTIDNPNWFNWGSSSLQTFLRFKTPAEAAAFERALPSFVERRAMATMGENASDALSLRLLPIADMHLTPEGPTPASRKLTVVTLGMVGILTLLIALVNYVNLATARAELRAREVAMRKVLGADRSAIRRQFLAEAVVTVACASLIGLMIAELCLPLVNAAAGLALAIPYMVIVPLLALVILVAGLLAGLYPAIVLSRFQPAAVLASARTPGGGRAGARLREGLVVLQFSLAIAFLIGTAVLVAQIYHLRDSDSGFERSGLITVLSLSDPLVEPAQKRAYLEAAAAMPFVRDIAIANSAAGGSGLDNFETVPLPGVSGQGPSLRWEVVGPGFFTVYGPRLLAGRDFGGNYGSDDFQTGEIGRPFNILINNAAVSALGFDSAQQAIGQTVGGDRPRTIVGVVDDMRFASPRNAISPTYYVYSQRPEELDSTILSLRVAGDSGDAIAQLQTLWQQAVPQVPFKAETADRRLAKFMKDDEQAARLFAIGALLAILIGCVGLWGLASFNTARRVREIGIRKTLGARSEDIVKLLVGQFLRPVLIANLIAWPIAFVAMRTWLAGFDDRIDLSPAFFVGASLIALAIAVATVVGQALRASRAAPAWALRHD